MNVTWKIKEHFGCGVYTCLHWLIEIRKYKLLLDKLDTGNEADIFNDVYKTDSDYFGYYLIKILYVDADYQC